MNPLDFSTISFPVLGLELNPPRTLSLGPLSIHLYGLMIALGLILAVVYSCRRSKEFGVKEKHLFSLLNLELYNRFLLHSDMPIMSL
mgnify:CR=1 FL=1